MSVESIAGILKQVNRNQFAVRRPQQSYRSGLVEIMVSNSLTRHYRLAEGASVKETEGSKEEAADLSFLDLVKSLYSVRNYKTTLEISNCAFILATIDKV